MSNKASIANLLNDSNTTSSSYDIQHTINSLNPFSINKKNIIPPRFTTTNIEKRQPLSTTTFTTGLMECPNLPRQSDTTIISGVQIVTNDDPPVLPHHHTFNQQYTGLPPLHPLYTYDPLPRMPVYKKSKKKQQPISSNPTGGDADVDMIDVVTIRPKRTYTKKPLDRLKRPRNGYMIYMNEVYEDVKRKNPNLKFGELSSLIGIQWKSMSKTDQMPYHQKHEEEKSAYESAKLAMSRTNLQIVEETIGIERQVKAAELKAAQIKNKQNHNHNNGKRTEGQRQRSQNEKPSQQKPIHNGEAYSERRESENVDGDNKQPPFGNERPHQSDAVIQPSNKISRQNIPITSTSPDVDNQALQLATPPSTINVRESVQKVTFIPSSREIQRGKPLTDEEIVRIVNEDAYNKAEEMNEIIDDDEEEQIDQLSSDIEKPDDIVVSSSPSTGKSLQTQEDTSKLWYFPIKGTSVSSGLTSPHRKRKVIRTEDSEEVVYVPKRFKKKVAEFLERGENH